MNSNEASRLRGECTVLATNSYKCLEGYLTTNIFAAQSILGVCN